MYSATAAISLSESFSATARIMRFGSLARSPERNAFSWAAVYSANCPASRGNWAGMPAPFGP